MNTYFFALLFALLIGDAVFFYFTFFRPATNNPAAFLKQGRSASTKTLIVCYGDSLTHATASGDYVALLREKFGAQGYEFVNAGINGNTTHDLLKRVDTVIACKPDVVTILVGTNDVNATRGEQAAFQYRLPYTPTLERYRQNYDNILTRLKAETNARIAIQSIPPLAEDLDSEINQRIAQYSAAIKDIAATHGVTYLPLYEALTAPLKNHTPRRTFTGGLGIVIGAAFKHYILRKTWDDISAEHGFVMLTDAIHLNNRGAALVANLIEGFLVSPN
jgi:acyl-CoA thioesterase-1